MSGDPPLATTIEGDELLAVWNHIRKLAGAPPSRMTLWRFWRRGMIPLRVMLKHQLLYRRSHEPPRTEPDDEATDQTRP